MARTSKDLVGSLGRAMASYESSVYDVGREVARELGVNESDARCLGLLLTEMKEARPGQLATRLGISAPGATWIIDRLERVGYATRLHDPADRRKVVVRATAQGARRAREVYDPLIAGGRQELISRYTVAELELIIDFLNRARDVQQMYVQRLRQARSNR